MTDHDWRFQLMACAMAASLLTGAMIIGSFVAEQLPHGWVAVFCLCVLFFVGRAYYKGKGDL